jgi:molecular chaperone DnaK
MSKTTQVAVQHPPIEIMQGKFNVAGQPLPNDICLEVDDYENNSTKLQVIFERNDILPLKKTVYKEITRTIKKGSDEGDCHQCAGRYPPQPSAQQPGDWRY